MIIDCESHAARLDDPASLGYAVDDARPPRRGATVDVHNSLEALLQRVAIRDRAAFRDLYAATSSRLFAVCLGLLRDRPRAEEALQEAFTRIWSARRAMMPKRRRARLDDRGDPTHRAQ